jgi:hypothetical protein
LNFEHPPALGQLWHLDAGAGGSLTTALKVENCFSVFFSPHSGHAGAFADADETKASFTNPHFVHLYSKIGISSSCLKQLYQLYLRPLSYHIRQSCQTVITGAD